MKKSAARILSLVLVMVMFLSLGITPAAAAEARGGFDDEEDVEITEPVAEEPAPEEGEDPAPAEEPAEPETPAEEPTEPEVPEEPTEPETPAEEPTEPEIPEEPTEPETPVEEPTEPEIPEKPEEPVAAEAAFPAATLGVVTESGMKVMVEAPEGAFPEGTEMSVREVAGSEIQSLIDASEFAGMESLVSADISFYANGVEIQPNGLVHVSITDNRLASAVDPMILHISDDGVVTSVDQDEDAQPAEGLKAAGAEIQSAAAVADASSGTLSFYTDSFSTYAVVQSSYTAGEEYVLVLYRDNRYYAITTSGGVVAATYADGRVTIDSLDNTTTLRYTYNAGGFGQTARFTAGNRTYYLRNNKLATGTNGNTYLGVNNAGTALTTNNSNGNGWNLFVAAPGDIEATEVTMKFIDEAGTPVYVSINGTDVTEAKLADVLASGTLDMSTYKASAASGGDKVLTYSNAQYNEYHADASATNSTCYVIGEEIQKSGARNFQFERADGQTKTWTNFNAGDSVYLVFSTVTGGSGGGSGSGGEDAPDLGAVGNSKELTDKEDGTYTLTLSVTGSAQSKEEETDINVLFIIDTSNSMTMWGRTRLADTKVAVNNMAEELLKNNTTSNPDAIQLGLIDFNASSSGLHTFSDGTKWTTLLGNKTNNTTTGFAGEVNSLTSSSGTNWEEALADVLNAQTDGDPTYVVFFTDGAPSQVKQTTDDHTLYNDEICYWACRDEARAIVRNGFTLYTIFAYGSTTDSNNDYLGKVTDYAYNANVKAQYRFNATDTTGVENALKSILNTINLNFAYANVAIDDGVTGMSTTTLANAAVDSLTYTITYRDYTSGTAYTDKTVTITENADGTISIPAVTYGVKDSNSTAGFKTITTKAVTVPGATYDTATGSVVWNIKKAGQTGDAAIYMLEDAWTYSVSFDLWPSQVSFDLVAALNNRLVTWGNDYTDPETGRVITFAEYKDQIGGASPGSYYLKTNTHATVSYQQYTAETDSEGNTTYTPVGEPKQVNIAYDDHMKLESTNILMEKQWETGLSEAELAELVFGKNYDSAPKYTGYKVVLKVYCDDQEYMTFTFPKLNAEGKPVDAEGVETLDIGALVWSDTLSIAPGILVQELPGGLNAADYKTLEVGGVDYYVLSDGHDYRIEEAEGGDLHFEYSSIVYHPMLKENKMINLDVETSIDSTTHQCTITGDTATIQDNNLTKFVGVNTLKGGVNIRKIVTTGTNKDEIVEDCTDVFAFEITLKDKAGNPYSTPTDQYSFTEPSGEGWSKDTTDPDNPFWYRSGCSMYNVYDGENKRIVRKPIPASGEFTVEMPADGEIRVVNLTAGVTYTVEEITDGNPGYEFVKTLYEVKLGENSEGDIIEDGSSVFGESVLVNGTIRGNVAELVTYYNWAAYFYVYHSANNTVEKISFSDERVKGTYDTEKGYTFEFNIIDELAENSLYGGYYSDYSKKSSGFDATAIEYDKNNIGTDEGGLPYTNPNIADGVWSADKAYTVPGDKASVEANHVYYLKEVPDTMYLQPYFHYTYNKYDNKIQTGWLLSDIDDGNYTDTGFVFIKDGKTAKVVSSLKLSSATSTSTVTLTAPKIFAGKGVIKGYLGYLQVMKSTAMMNSFGTNVEIRQYWKTCDGMYVTGANARTYTNLNTKGTITKVDNSVPMQIVTDLNNLEVGS